MRLFNKKGAAASWMSWISPLIWLVIIVLCMIYGGVFFASIKSAFSGGFSFTNPWLWVIAILVLILLITRRRK
jgi:hypothetical protein